jgi:hypothetical protein
MKINHLATLQTGGKNESRSSNKKKFFEAQSNDRPNRSCSLALLPIRQHHETRVDKQRSSPILFVEQNSTKECYRQPLPLQNMELIASKLVL